MPISVRSFAKINIGLAIGPKRADGFHQLGTVYQTISLHDTIRVDIRPGTGIEIRCRDQRVPLDESNTCYRVADRVMRSLKRRHKVVITIEKHLPVQGGLGAGSSNGVATLLAMERGLKEELPPEERLRITAAVGSDLPLFLLGGTILGMGRGELVFPLHDQPEYDVVIVTPKAGVSTPQAFAKWDELVAQEQASNSGLTPAIDSDRISVFSRSVFAWLRPTAGVPAAGSPSHAEEAFGETSDGDRAETSLLDLVRAGIENDFERVVFPQYPELRELKRALEREGARYASLSGSGSTLYGLFDNAEIAAQAARRVSESRGVTAVAARTVSRRRYWDEVLSS